MNATYTLTEGNDALNRVLLMMQYELGKTLDEQKIPTDKDLKNMKKMSMKMLLVSMLIIHDVKKGIDTGNWEWGNLIIDVLMVASAGVLGFGLKAIATSGKLLGKGLSEIIQTLIKTKGGEKIVEFLRILSTKSAQIIKSIKPGLEWFSKSIVAQGAKWLSKGTLLVIKKTLQGVGFVISKLSLLIEKMSIIIQKLLNKIGITGKLGKGLGAAGGITAFNLSIKAIEGIHDKWVQMGKDATLKLNNEKFLIEGNQKIYGKDIIYNYFDGKYTIKMKRDINGIYYIYSDKYKEWQEVYPDEYTPEQLQSTIRNGLFNRTDLKFNEFKILDKKNNIYEINNNKYQLIPGNEFKLKQI
jgi:hypothetical protein